MGPGSPDARAPSTPMYIITLASNQIPVYNASTVDAAIIAARDFAKAKQEYVAVREKSRAGSTIKVIATPRRAYWVVPCKPCNAVGRHMDMFGGAGEECTYCKGIGAVEDLQC